MTKRKPRARFRPLLRGLLAVVLLARPLQADETMRQVQEELRKRHLYFGDVDGRLTPQVSAALRRYQELKGFAPSGAPDEATLRSLTLLPPPPPGSPVSSLPDVTVLRSDEGRGAIANPVEPPNEAESPPAVAASLPTPAPPPAAAAIQRPGTAEIRAFLERYLEAGQTNDPAAELRFYGDRVNYFDDGLVDQQFIAQDVRRYDHRWPERQFALSGPVDVANPPAGRDAAIQVHFRYRFAVKNSRYAAAGEADNEYLLTGTRPEELRIVSLKEQRVRP